MTFEPEAAGGEDVILERLRHDIIASRFLIVQAKRLQLSSAYRRRVHAQKSNWPELIERLEGEVVRADRQYRAAVLEHASPQSADYWIVAYARLLEVGEDLSDRMRTAAVDLPADARFEVSTDVEALALILARWNESMKRSMAKAVA